MDVVGPTDLALPRTDVLTSATILVVDDEFVRHTLRSLLAQQPLENL